MATLQNKKIVGTDWVSANTLFNVPIGVGFSLFNRSNYPVIIQENAIQPLSTDYSGKLLAPVMTTYCNINVDIGSYEIWLRNTKEGREAIIAGEIV